MAEMAWAIKAGMGSGIAVHGCYGVGNAVVAQPGVGPDPQEHESEAAGAGEA